MGLFKTPVLFLVFNRPDVTRVTFEQIRSMQPSKLFVSADGPRMHVPGEVERCQQVRDIVLHGVDWDCEVKTLFRDDNKGCAMAVSEAISWFFDEVEEGIILEDDCLPNTSFFTFCEELLERYRHVENVAHISGDNFQCGQRRGSGDYYFSHFSHIWGWATWRRAWKNYDFNMSHYDLLKRKHPMRKMLPVGLLDDVKAGKICTWDMQWFYTNLWKRHLSIMPNINLVRNIGFSKEATHTVFGEPDYIKKSSNGDLSFPLKHPARIAPDMAADRFTATVVFGIRKITFLNALSLFFRKYLLPGNTKRHYPYY